MRKHSHYHKNVANLNTIDVYRVLSLWCVSDPALQHAIKKLLNAGQRGMKDWHKDLREAIDSIERALEMRGEDDPQSIDTPDEHKDTVQIGKVTATFTGPAASGKTRLVMQIEDFIAGKPNASVDALIHELVTPTLKERIQAATAYNPLGIGQPLPTPAAPPAPSNQQPMPPQAPAQINAATGTPESRGAAYHYGRAEALQGLAPNNPFPAGSPEMPLYVAGHVDGAKERAEKQQAQPVVTPPLDPYSRGRAARRSGMLASPYKIGSIEAVQWENGYQDEKTANYGKEAQPAPQQPKPSAEVEFGKFCCGQRNYKPACPDCPE